MTDRATDVVISPDDLARALRMARVSIARGDPPDIALDLLTMRLARGIARMDPFLDVPRFTQLAGMP